MRSPFPELVATELARARTKHAPMGTIHEGYAVLLEEVDELWAEIKRRNPDRSDILGELVQVGAMCQRFAEDVGLVLQRLGPRD